MESNTSVDVYCMTYKDCEDCDSCKRECIKGYNNRDVR